jgi:hypothetical protein
VTIENDSIVIVNKLLKTNRNQEVVRNEILFTTNDTAGNEKNKTVLIYTDVKKPKIKGMPDNPEIAGNLSYNDLHDGIEVNFSEPVVIDLDESHISGPRGDGCGGNNIEISAVSNCSGGDYCATWSIYNRDSWREFCLSSRIST